MATKKSYGDLQKQMEKLLAQQQKMEQDAVDAFTKALMGTDARKQLAALSNADLQAVAKFAAANMGVMIKRVQADRTAKAAAKQQAPAPAQSAPAPSAVPPMGNHG